MRRALIATMALAVATPVMARPAMAKPTTEQRLDRLEAESDIRRAIVEYGKALDAKDYAGYARLFARNGEWSGGMGTAKGPAAIEAMLLKALGKPEAGYVNKQSFHLISNIIVEVTGDHATAWSRLTFFTKSPEGRPQSLLAGHYVDDWVREDGQWRILKRVTYGDIPFRDGAQPGPAPAPPAPSDNRP